MSPLRLVASLGILALAACPVAESPADVDPDAPLGCSSDGDCGALPCGPCGAGEVVRVSSSSAECVVNPCPGARAVCGSNHVCVVAAATHGN